MIVRLIVMLTVGAAMAGFSPSATAAQPSVVTLLQDPTTANFAEVPGVPKCVTMAPLRGNLGTGPASAMVRMTSGCVVPYHWHTPSEELIVLRGAPLGQMLGMRPTILKVGSYSQLPSKHVHRFRCDSKEDCVLVLVTGGVFDIHFVDAAGKEITTQAALIDASRSAHTRW